MPYNPRPTVDGWFIPPKGLDWQQWKEAVAEVCAHVGESSPCEDIEPLRNGYAMKRPAPPPAPPRPSWAATAEDLDTVRI